MIQTTFNLRKFLFPPVLLQTEVIKQITKKNFLCRNSILLSRGLPTFLQFCLCQAGIIYPLKAIKTKSRHENKTKTKYVLRLRSKINPFMSTYIIFSMTCRGKLIMAINTRKMIETEVNL